MFRKFRTPVVASFVVVCLGAMGLGATASHAQTNSISAAVLPTSRATQIDTPVTVFATILNSGPGTAYGCQVSLAPDEGSGGPNPSGLQMHYRAYLGDNTTPAADTDTPIDVSSGAAQAFVLSVQGSQQFLQKPVYFQFECDTGASTAAVYREVNTLLLTVSTNPVPDVISIASSPSNNGIVEIPALGGGMVMAVAAVNIGAASTPVTSVDGKSAPAANNIAYLTAVPGFGTSELPLTTFVCETNPATAECLAPYNAFVSSGIGDEAVTFSVFTNSLDDAGVPFFSDIARQNLYFLETTAGAADRPEAAPASVPDKWTNNYYSVGATGLAVTSPGPALPTGATDPVGLWSLQINAADGTIWKGRAAVSPGRDTVAKLYKFPGNNDEMLLGGAIYGDVTDPQNPTAQFYIDRYTYNQTGGQDKSRISGPGLWQPRMSIDASLTPSGGGNNAHVRATFDTLYDRVVDMSALPTNYGVVLENDAGSLQYAGSVVMDAGTTVRYFNGTITPETGVTCNLTGHITDYEEGKNLFELILTAADCAYAGNYYGELYQLDDTRVENKWGAGNDVLHLLFRSIDGTSMVEMRFVPGLSTGADQVNP